METIRKAEIGTTRIEETDTHFHFIQLDEITSKKNWIAIEKKDINQLIDFICQKVK